MTPPVIRCSFGATVRPGFDPYYMGLEGSGGQFQFTIEDASSTAATIRTPVPYNQWLQVTSTFDDSSGIMRIYTNGILAASSFTTIRPMLALDPSASPGIDIGNTDPGNDFPFLGAIDEVVLYNRALSPTEVLSLVPEPASGTLISLSAAVLWLVNRGRKAGLGR